MALSVAATVAFSKAKVVDCVVLSSCVDGEDELSTPKVGDCDVFPTAIDGVMLVLSSCIAAVVFATASPSAVLFDFFSS